MQISDKASAAAAAAEFPVQPLRIALPGSWGKGGTDTHARLIGDQYNARFGMPALLDNRNGGNGTLAAMELLRGCSDASMLLLVPGGFAANRYLFPTLPYDPDIDLLPVSQLTTGPLVLVVEASLGISCFAEFAEYARAHPGTLNYATSGNGSLPHLGAELLRLQGLKIGPGIHYVGSGKALHDLTAAKNVQFMLATIAALPDIEAGKLRALALTSRQRSATFPGVPTLAESGLPSYDITNWYGTFASHTTASSSIHAMQRELARIMALPDVQQRLDVEGASVVASTPEQFSAFLASETEKFRHIITASGIRAQQGN